MLRLSHAALLGCAALLLGGCALPDVEIPNPLANRNTPVSSPAPARPTLAPPAVGGDQPVLLTGTYTYTNDIITDYYVEHSVMLTDMYGFVTRDEEWELPVDSQILGYTDLDEERREGTFRLSLPALPTGQAADVDNNGQQNSGVQVYALAWSPNLTDGPFSVGDDRSRGWPSYLASVRTDSENDDEVIGGKLVVWAADETQQFPTGFGDDGKLFTADDPVDTLPAGYTVIDLDQRPFARLRNAEEQLTLYEPKDAAIKDFADLSYTAAFDAMFKQVSTEYAFNGIPDKSPDWDTLYAELKPRVEQAEQRRDGKAFYLAIRDFTLAFNDGHVGMGGGEYGSEVFLDAAGGGYGFTVRELEDGRFLVVQVTSDGAAAKAGMQVGATLTAFGGRPTADAVADVVPAEGPFSTDFARRYQQVRYLTRAPLGTDTPVTFQNPGGAAQTATLEAEQEFESLFATDPTGNYDPNALPVEFRILPEGPGYVRINSNNDDLNLLIRLFKRALATFEENDVPGIIIDMRVNFGGSPLGLAGFLTDQTISIGQDEYYSEATGKFEPEGTPGEITPNEEQFSFDRIVLLTDQSCYSACEIESYGFSKVPGTVVVGEYPTAGVFAEVSRGQYALPDGLSLQVPTGRTVLADGTPLLEGVGVVPNVRVPATEKGVLSGDDVVLRRGIQEITGR